MELLNFLKDALAVTDGRPVSLVVSGDALVADPLVFGQDDPAARALTDLASALVADNRDEWIPSTSICLRAPQLDGTMVRFDADGFHHQQQTQERSIRPFWWFVHTQGHSEQELLAFAQQQQFFDASSGLVDRPVCSG